MTENSRQPADFRRPIGCPPELWDVMIHIRHAQERLEDDYPKWNAAGKKHAVTDAAQELRQAHQNLTHYIEQIGPKL